MSNATESINLTDQQSVSEFAATDVLDLTPAPAATNHNAAIQDITDLGAKTIQAELFRTGVLLHVSASTYSGVVSQDEEDLRVQGVENNHDAEQHVFKPGHKRLIRKEALTPFTEWRGRIQGYLNGVSTPFLDMGGTRLVLRSRIRAVLDQMEVFKNELEGIITTFMGLDDANYRTEQQLQAGIFDARYPDRVGYLNEFFLTPAQVRRKFSLSWKTFQISEVSDAERAGIRAEEAGAIRQQAASYKQELADGARKLVQGRLVQIAKAMSVKGKVNGDRVLGLVDEMLEKFGNADFTNDVGLREMIESVRRHASNVANWKTDAGAKAELFKVVEAQKAQLAKELADADVVEIAPTRRAETIADADDAVDAEEAPEEAVSVRRAPMAQDDDAADADDDAFDDETLEQATTRILRGTPAYETEVHHA